MNYNWNIRIWVEQYLPTMLRKPIRIALHYCLLAPIQQMWFDFIEKKTVIDFDTMFSSETICFEEKLNILFDPVLTRISIQTNDDVGEIHYSFNRSETIDSTEEEYSYSRSEVIDPSLYIYTYNRGELLNPFDFTVQVPTGVNTLYAEKIKQEIEKYRLAGKRYQIILT